MTASTVVVLWENNNDRVYRTVVVLWENNNDRVYRTVLSVLLND